MAHHYLQIWELVEYSTQDQPQELHPGLIMPTDPGRAENRIQRLAEPAVIGIAYRFPRRLGMKVERRSQGSRSLEDRPEIAMIQIALARPSEQHPPIEPEFRDGPFEFACRRGRRRVASVASP